MQHLKVQLVQKNINNNTHEYKLIIPHIHKRLNTSGNQCHIHFHAYQNYYQ